MNIYTLKTQFEEMVLPSSSHTLVNAQQAWEIFKASVRDGLDENYCEELGFSTSVASYYDGKSVHYDEDQFQVYFGRLIDAEKGYPWRTAEVNFY